MIKIKKFKLIIALISLLVCMTFIQETYAKYVNNVAGEAEMTIARWKILVNNSDITAGNLTQATITPVFSGNTNIKANVVAPTSTGYFDIIIDGTNTDVTFNYTVTTTPSATSNVSDLVSTGYSLDGGTTIISFSSYNESITGTVAYGSTTFTTIRVYVMWNDNLEATMTNADDTVATTTANTKATMDVSLSFIQNNS